MRRAGSGTASWEWSAAVTSDGSLGTEDRPGSESSGDRTLAVPPFVDRTSAAWTFVAQTSEEQTFVARPSVVQTFVVRTLFPGDGNGVVPFEPRREITCSVGR